MAAASALLYGALLILPWVLIVVSYRLVDSRGLENLRLLLYAMVFTVSALAAMVFLTTDDVSIGWESTVTAPQVSAVSSGGLYTYTAANTTEAAEVVLYAPAEGVGEPRDAQLLGLLYAGLALLYMVLAVSEIFRLASKAWE